MSRNQNEGKTISFTNILFTTNQSTSFFLMIYVNPMQNILMKPRWGKTDPGSGQVQQRLSGDSGKDDAIQGWRHQLFLYNIKYQAHSISWCRHSEGGNEWRSANTATAFTTSHHWLLLNHNAQTFLIQWQMLADTWCASREGGVCVCVCVLTNWTTASSRLSNMDSWLHTS